ncbi:hydroxymethylglutaryl-CoA synthase family protein [Zavarzinia sp. CC-PAN008]|uniref:hydroxymethylglutaryl-CoA synthase family protein n=1 Tax=Zavarzinia sp. CC-PAN008 TaxID=3243332 RepID=UPI003F7480F3
MVGITAFGGYIPKLRLQRKAIATANAWSNPGIMGQAKGERSMRNWDEDSLTMAVEAGRDCLTGFDKAAIDQVIFASTTMPFADRQNAGVVATVLNLSDAVQTLDVTSSQRAGTSALLAALSSVKAGTATNALLVASDTRATRSGSNEEMLFGDGAASLLVGNDKPIAEYLGGASISIDFVDHFRGEGQDFDYGWEERWIRDEGYMKIGPKAVKAALAKSGIEAGAIDHFVMPCIFAKIPADIAKASGIDPKKARDNLHAVCGETGTAHALTMLIETIQSVGPGQTIMVVGYGQGADVLIFRTTDALAGLSPRRGIKGSLADRREETNYMKYLAFNNLVTQEKGKRAEGDKGTALSVLYRKRDQILGLVGGKCRVCGTLQYPKSDICVNPNCHAPDSQDPHPFQDEPAKIMTWSADYLTYTIDPPAHYGMVTFQDGGRFMTDFTDYEQGKVEVGMPVRMTFRLKEVDEDRGFKKYFWKAVPTG